MHNKINNSNKTELSEPFLSFIEKINTIKILLKFKDTPHLHYGRNHYFADHRTVRAQHVGLFTVGSSYPSKHREQLSDEGVQPALDYGTSPSARPSQVTFSLIEKVCCLLIIVFLKFE
jgi:hypothetical protein